MEIDIFGTKLIVKIWSKFFYIYVGFLLLAGLWMQGFSIFMLLSSVCRLFVMRVYSNKTAKAT